MVWDLAVAWLSERGQRLAGMARLLGRDGVVHSRDEDGDHDSNSNRRGTDRPRPQAVHRWCFACATTMRGRKKRDGLLSGILPTLKMRHTLDPRARVDAMSSNTMLSTRYLYVSYAQTIHHLRYILALASSTHSCSAERIYRIRR